jgi:hypothetical protein
MDGSMGRMWTCCGRESPRKHAECCPRKTVAFRRAEIVYRVELDERVTECDRCTVNRTVSVDCVRSPALELERRERREEE